MQREYVRPSAAGPTASKRGGRQHGTSTETAMIGYITYRCVKPFVTILARIIVKNGNATSPSIQASS